MIARNSHLPNSIQVSVLMAVAMIGYTMTRYIDDAPQKMEYQLSYIYFSMTISTQMIIAVLVAGMVASGMYWLVYNHPHLDRNRAWHHVWLPALTTWVTSTLLNLLPEQGMIWWIVLTLGMFFFAGVLVAEYITVDMTDSFYRIASSILTILAFCIYSAVILTWHNASYRLFILFPATFIASGIMAMRIFFLNIPDSPVFIFTFSLAMISAHISAALHYIPLTSLQFCLFIVGIIYSCITLVINFQKQTEITKIISGPISIAIIFIISGLIIK